MKIQRNSSRRQTDQVQTSINLPPQLFVKTFTTLVDLSVSVSRGHLYFWRKLSGRSGYSLQVDIHVLGPTKIMYY